MSFNTVVYTIRTRYSELKKKQSTHKRNRELKEKFKNCSGGYPGAGTQEHYEQYLS